MKEEPATDEDNKKNAYIWFYIIFGVFIGFATTLYQEISSFDDWPKPGQHAFRFAGYLILMIVASVSRGVGGKIQVQTKSNSRFTKRFLVMIFAALFGAFIALGIDQNFGDY